MLPSTQWKGPPPQWGTFLFAEGLWRWKGKMSSREHRLGQVMVPTFSRGPSSQDRGDIGFLSDDRCWTVPAARARAQTHRVQPACMLGGKAAARPLQPRSQLASFGTICPAFDTTALSAGPKVPSPALPGLCVLIREASMATLDVVGYRA